MMSWININFQTEENNTLHVSTSCKRIIFLFTKPSSHKQDMTSTPQAQEFSYMALHREGQEHL